MLEDQLNYFVTLRQEVKQLRDQGKTLEEVKAATEGIKRTIRREERLARYLGGMFEGQIEKIYEELAGKPAAPKSASARPIDELRQRRHSLTDGMVVQRVR